MSSINDFKIENGVLTNYYGWNSVSEIVIPDGVTRIAAPAFQHCHYASSITIPNSVESIGSGAFSWSTIMSIEIPGSVKIIEKEAFFNCKVSTILINDGVESIGDEAFALSHELTKVTLPNSVRFIGKRAFNCRNLKDIVIPKEIESYEDSVVKPLWESLDSSELKFNILMQLFENGNSAVLENKVISRYAKANKDKIFRIAIEKNQVQLLVALFSLYAKFDLDDLDRFIKLADKSIDIKAFLMDYKAKHYSVEKQEKRENLKFEKALGIKKLSVADIKKIWKYRLDSDGNITLTMYCGRDSVLYIPDKIGKSLVTRIGAGVCSDCNNIECIVIPEGIVAIGPKAFSSNKKLSNVVLPDSLVVVGDGSFDKCKLLKDMPALEDKSVAKADVSAKSEYDFCCLEYIKATWDYYINDQNTCTIKKYIGYEVNIDIPESLFGVPVTEIGDGAFAGCKNLTSVSLPNEITSIGDGAFEDCTALEAIAIPGSNTSICDYAFSGCTSLTSVTIPNNVAYIGRDAFEGTRYINDKKNWSNDVLFIGNHLIRAKTTLSGEYSIKDGTKTIAADAFSGCTSLTSVTIPGNLKSIGIWAFASCKNLNSITIPDSVTSIECGVFASCSSLSTLTIPNSVSRIALFAFRDCKRLASITIPSSVTKIERAFEGCKNLTIHAPAGSYAEQYAKENNIKFIVE